MPTKLNDNFIRERYEKDQKYIFVYDTYTPNYNKRNITSKFYSKYEADTDEVDEELLRNLIWARDYGPKQKLQWPETENQWYGWYSTPLVEMNRTDERLYFPQKSSDMTKHGVALLKNKRK